jgi:regulator of sirC expression with transglutaminase-like and TPR domain
MDESAARERFRSLLARPDDEVPLAECALTFAAEARPGLDVAAYLAQLDALAEALRRRHRPDMSVADTIVVLNRYLFDELGFAANAQDYYDPRNSYLNEVLDRRIGIPITLSVVYLEIGRRLGLVLDGVSFPGHFLVKCALKEGTVVIDPYLKGASLGIDDLTKRLRALQGGSAPRPPVSALLAAASSREIIVRMLRNLKVIHLEAKAWREALWALDYQLIAAPEAVEAYRERGNVYLEMECFRAALGDFEQYLKLAADADDAAEIRIRVAELKSVAARLN